MPKLRSRTFKKVKHTKARIRGKSIDVAVFRRGNLEVQVPFNEIDQVETITTHPKRWMGSKLVIPIGKRDEEGFPIYKVIRLNKDIAKKRSILNKENRR